MEQLGNTINLDNEGVWVTISIILFILLIGYFLIKLFSVLFEFIQAKGCLTIGLISLVGLPGIVVLSLVAGYTLTSSILILFAIIGVITGYIALDSEENVGKFGLFILIVSSITLIMAIIVKIFHLL